MVDIIGIHKHSIYKPGCPPFTHTWKLFGVFRDKTKWFKPFMCWLNTFSAMSSYLNAKISADPLPCLSLHCKDKGFLSYLYCRPLQISLKFRAKFEQKYTNPAHWHPWLLLAKVVAPLIMPPNTPAHGLSQFHTFKPAILPIPKLMVLSTVMSRHARWFYLPSGFEKCFHIWQVLTVLNLQRITKPVQILNRPPPPPYGLGLKAGPSAA